MSAFPNVWFLARRPAASLAAVRARRTGTLTIDGGILTFRDRSGETRVEGIESARWFGYAPAFHPRATDLVDGAIDPLDVGHEDDDVVNGWLEVRYLTPTGRRAAVWIADGGWFGWRAQILARLGRETKQEAIARTIRDQVSMPDG